MSVIINGELIEVLALPDQTGHAGQALVTDGNTADWAALAGTGDMAKSTYDANNNGIVDQAATVNDGAGNSKTAAQIKTHIDSTSNPHNVTAAQIGVAATPSGTGMVHVTAGVQDAASKLIANTDVDAAAAIAESKLSLNYPTHSTVNDPSSDQKNALVGTNGTPYSGNRYVTDSDPRNTNTRTPVAHGSAQHTGTIGTPTQVGLSNVPNVDATNATNITSGTLPGARLPAMSSGTKGGVPATGSPSGKYLKDNGTWDTPAGAGDMLKATYDTGDNGIVDKAASVDDGAGNAKTALEVKTAIDTTIPGKATLVAGAVNGNLAGLDAGGDLTDSGNAPADFAPAAKGVTDGDSHDHTGGSGAAITESALSLSNVTTGNVDDTKHGFCPITPNDTDKYLRGDGTWAIPPSGGSPPSGTGWRHVTAGVEDGAASTPSKTDVGLGNVANLDQTNPANITQDATHRFATDAEKSSWNAKLDPSGSGANLTGIPEGALSFTNITTNNVSTAKHGLTPIAPNDTTKFLRGDATWAVPSAGSVSWPLVTSKSEISPGDTGYASLDAILAGPPAAGTSILVQSGTHTLHASNNRTLPAGVNMRVLPGALITIPSGRTFTINGHLDAGPYQIFDNSANAALLASDSSLTVTITHSGTDQTWTRSAGNWSANYVASSLFTAFGVNLASVNVGTFPVVSGAGTSALVVTNPNAENGDQSGIAAVNCYGGDLSKGVKFGYKSVSYIRAEWFGAVANDTAVGSEETANFRAFNFAMNATIAKNVIPTFFSSGNYYLNGGIACGSCSALGALGVSMDNNTEEASMLNFKNSTHAICISGAFKWIKGIQIQMGSVNTRGILVNSVTPRCAEIEYNFIYGQYADNTDDVYKIYIVPGSEQTKTRFNRVQGPGAGIYDAGDGGQTHFNEVEGSGQLTTGIFADGSSCLGNQVQYHKYGFQIGTNGPRLVRNLGQQCMIGFYAPASRNLDMDGCGVYSNYTFGILALGIQSLNLVNNKFAGNLDGSLCYNYGSHINGYGNIFDDYINDSARHYKTPSVVPDPLGIGSYNFTYANLFDNPGLDLPYVNQNGTIGVQPFNYYQITGLNCTFNVGYSTGLTVTVTKTATTTWVRSSGSWVTDGFVAGMDVDFTGFANPSNNDRWRIVSIGGAGNNTLTTSNSSQFGRDSVEVTNDAGVTAQGQPVLTRDSGGSGDWDTDFITSGVTEGDCIQLGGNWAHIQNTRLLLTTNRVAANAIYFITSPGGTAGMAASANESVADSSGTVTHVPLIHGKQAVINSPNSGKVIAKFLNNAPGSSLTLTLDDANVGFAKWAEPEAAWVVTGGGVTATLITGDSSWTAFTATAQQHDAVVWVSDILTGAIKVTTSQAFVSAGHVFTWEYLKTGGTWAALPAISLNDPWSASPGAQEVYFRLPSDAVPGVCDDYYTPDSMGRVSGYLIRCRLSTAGTPSVAGTCSSVLSACWMRLTNDTIAAPSVGETKVLRLENNANVSTQSN